MFRSHPKPEKKEKKKKGLKRKRKATGEAQVFLKCWSEREHICTNCKVYLGEVAHSYNFAHLIRKGRDGSGRLNPDNILLHCFECHQQMDQGTSEGYNKRKGLHEKEEQE